MTPREKAEELFKEYYQYIFNSLGNYCAITAKQCALICIDEILNASPSLPILSDSGGFGDDINLSTKYWQEVKQEIEKL